MPRKKRRGPVTLNGESRNLGGGATGTWGDTRGSLWTDVAASVATGDTAGSGAAYTLGDGTTTGWMPSNYADMNMWITLNGAPAPDSSVTSWTVDSPSPGLTTWFQVDPSAYTAADIGAATDTLAATGSGIATGISNAVTGAANVLSGIFNNLTPILIALAALYVWRESERNK